MNQAALARKNLEKRLAPLRAMTLRPPARGWIRALRQAFGMTTEQLATRIGVKQPRIIALEKAEAHGAVTLKTLREAAEAMDCTLVYAIVPRQPFDAILRARAIERANKELARLDHTMRLENQSLTREDLARERERLIASYLEGSPRRLWDEP